MLDKTDYKGVNQEWTIQRHMDKWKQERLYYICSATNVPA